MTLAFGSRVPVPVKGRKSAPGDIPSPSKRASSLPPVPAALQDLLGEEDMELEQDDETPGPAPSPPSKPPSPPPRSDSPAVSNEEPGEEQLEIETTPPEGDDATGRWRDEVTMASNPESAEEVGLGLDDTSG
jgi:hypothetical protein